jgi:hypothetical protein
MKEDRSKRGTWTSPDQLINHSDPDWEAKEAAKPMWPEHIPGWPERPSADEEDETFQHQPRIPKWRQK